MPQIPREPRPGERPDSTTLIQLIRYVRDLERRLAALRPAQTRRGGAQILRTLFVAQAGDAAVSVSVGRIANLPLYIDGVELGADPAPTLPITTSGVVYIGASFEADGEPTDDPQGFAVLAGADVPADTEVASYKVLAEVTMADGKITALNPVAWNFSEIRRCGSVYEWGGFGA